MSEGTVWSEKGFLALREHGFHRRLGELEIVAAEEPDALLFRVSCASSQVDSEPEMERFAQQQTKADNGLTVTYRKRLLEVTCQQQEGMTQSEMIDNSLSLLETMMEQFALLPVCTHCGRITPAELTEVDGQPEVVCGVCKDAMVLNNEMEQKLEEQRLRYADEYTVGGLQRRPIKAAVKAGFLGGLYTCVVGALYMSVLWVFFGPLVHLTFGFMGAITGFFTIRKCNRIGYIPAWQKFIVSTVSAFVTLFVVSGMTYLLLNRLIFHGEFMDMFGSRLYDLGHPVLYMIVFGLGTFFLSEFLFGFMFPGKSREA